MSHSSFLNDESSFYAALPDAVGMAEPFIDAEEAWFWCVQTSEAIHSGIRLRPGMGSSPRPCEAVDIQKVVLRLADQKMLNDQHVAALCHYGRRKLRPVKPAHLLHWQQAMQRLTPILQRKGIIA